MKHIQKIIAILVLIGIFHISYGENMKVQEVSVLDSKMLKVVLSENPNLDAGEVQGEITLLNDVAMRGAVLAEGAEQKVELMLEDPMKAETSYSLLTISGADGSIEFITPKDVEGFVATNTLSGDTQNIASVEILDEKTLSITYHKAINSSSFEYKLLAESKVTKIEKPDYFLPELEISLETELSSHKKYILMFIEMQDVDGNFIEFDTGIFDFSTTEVVKSETNLNEEKVDMKSETEILDESLTEELRAAPEDTSIEKDTTAMDTVEAAKNVSETPDTGAETWVLIIATWVINTLYYLSRRKKALFA